MVNDSELTCLARIGAEVKFVECVFTGGSLVGTNLSGNTANDNIYAKLLGTVGGVLTYSIERQATAQGYLG